MERLDDAYRAAARAEVVSWKEKPPSRGMEMINKPFKFVGYPVQRLLDTERGRKLLERAVSSFFSAGTWRFSTDDVLRSYCDLGYQVFSLADIRSRVPLSVMDKSARKHWIAATAILTVEGGIAGPAMAAAATAAGSAAAAAATASGGTAGPAAAAAGLAVVGTAAAAETAFLISYCCRRLASIAACYGYDASDDRERAFALSVLSVATAENMRAKEIALADLGNLAGRLGLQKQPWQKLESRSVIARAVRELAEKLGWRLTQAQLRRVLTVIGAALGAGFNGHLAHTTTRAGYFLYRERVLDESVVERNALVVKTVNDSPVPPAIARAVEAWEARQRPGQRATWFVRDAWIEACPGQRETLLDLPDRLDRAAVSEVISRLDRAQAGWEIDAFVVTQVWGYGDRAHYGPSRVRQILDHAGANAAVSLSAAVRLCHEEGPVAAFEALATEHKLRGLSTSFATKFLFFVDPSDRALILDDFLAKWLRAEADLRLTLQPMNPGHYARYLSTMTSWASATGLSPTTLEEVLFGVAAAGHPASRW